MLFSVTSRIIIFFWGRSLTSLQEIHLAYSKFHQWEVPKQVPPPHIYSWYFIFSLLRNWDFNIFIQDMLLFYFLDRKVLQFYLFIRVVVISCVYYRNIAILFFHFKGVAISFFGYKGVILFFSCRSVAMFFFFFDSIL